MLETLYNNLVREDADVAMCGIYSEYANGIKEHTLRMNIWF